MILRIAPRRSILSLRYPFQDDRLRDHLLYSWDGTILQRKAGRHVCVECRRRIFTEVVRGKSVPFFQRSIISTPGTCTNIAAAALEEPIPPPQSTVEETLTPSQSARQSIQRSNVLKSPTLWTYMELGKPRLSVLIVLTTMSAYSLSPFPGSLPTLLLLSAGTYLCCASANTFNMIAEPQFDGLMSRTRNRPLVRKALSPSQARVFGATTAVTGVTALALGVNPVVAALGASNIILYAAIYTPLKRKTIANTWVGAVVGGVPPLMGWAACSPDGSLILHPGGLLLAALLYAWQFPHFNALSHTMRHDYARAGYKMMCVTNPPMNARVALRYSIVCIPICWGLVACGLVDPWYLVDSTIINGWVCSRAWKFWRQGGEGGSARGLFFATLIQLPALLVLAMLHKEGLWDWLWEKDEEENGDAVEP